MGRKCLNRTEDELKEQNRVRQRRFYERHSNDIRKEKLRKYYERRNAEKIND